MRNDPTAHHVAMGNYRGDAPGYEKKDIYEGQPYWLSEVGGTFFPSPDEDAKRGWGYGKPPADEEEFIRRYEGKTRVMLEHPRICGFCYTQLTDIEQEQNGLFSYGRKPKFSPEGYERIKKANLQIAAIEKED
jgi:hypothetical protein